MNEFESSESGSRILVNGQSSSLTTKHELSSDIIRVGHCFRLDTCKAAHIQSISTIFKLSQDVYLDSMSTKQCTISTTSNIVHWLIARLSVYFKRMSFCTAWQIFHFIDLLEAHYIAYLASEADEIFFDTSQCDQSANAHQFIPYIDEEYVSHNKHHSILMLRRSKRKLRASSNCNYSNGTRNIQIDHHPE